MSPNPIMTTSTLNVNITKVQTEKYISIGRWQSPCMKLNFCRDCFAALALTDSPLCHCEERSDEAIFVLFPSTSCKGKKTTYTDALGRAFIAAYHLLRFVQAGSRANC